MDNSKNNVLQDVKKELEKLIDNSKKYPDCGKQYTIAYRNVLAMIKYAEDGRLDELFIDNCLHKKTESIYFESYK